MYIHAVSVLADMASMEEKIAVVQVQREIDGMWPASCDANKTQRGCASPSALDHVQYIIYVHVHTDSCKRKSQYVDILAVLTGTSRGGRCSYAFCLYNQALLLSKSFLPKLTNTSEQCAGKGKLCKSLSLTLAL